MSVLQQLPAIMRVLIVFVGVLFLIRKKLSLGHTFVMGAILLSFFFGLHPTAMIGSMAGSIVYPKTLSLALIVSSILIFKGILEDSHAVEEISSELIMIKVPLMLVAVMLPFLVGLITGITIAFVGVTLPILIPLIHSLGETGFIMPYVMLTMVCGFSGVLLSPLHLCLILSNEYFNAGMLAVYRHFWLLCVCLMSSGIAYFIISHCILKII